VRGDPRGGVHRPTEIVAILKDHRTCVDARVHRREPGRWQPVGHFERRDDGTAARVPGRQRRAPLHAAGCSWQSGVRASLHTLLGTHRCGEIRSCRTAAPHRPNFPADVEHNLAHDHIGANDRDVVSP
jgi:hypothetical protein